MFYQHMKELWTWTLSSVNIHIFFIWSIKNVYWPDEKVIIVYYTEHYLVDKVIIVYYTEHYLVDKHAL
jgi:hypothetical protein